jgi:hypothetical protein
MEVRFVGLDLQFASSNQQQTPIIIATAERRLPPTASLPLELDLMLAAFLRRASRLH